MNILAHTYLLQNLDDVFIGNYISDAVKGNNYKEYPKSVQQGIMLHRKIDSFTDKHESTLKCKKLFYPIYGHHSSVVIDIVFDYFLASQWNKYHKLSLSEYSCNIYTYLKKKMWIMPERIQYLTPYLIENNWFELYSNLNGIERVLSGMSKRTSMPAKANEAISIINKNNEELFVQFDTLINDISQISRGIN